MHTVVTGLYVAYETAGVRSFMLMKDCQIHFYLVNLSRLFYFNLQNRLISVVSNYLLRYNYSDTIKYKDF